MIATLLLWLIRAYQLTLSPMLGRVCRFEPSCSRYAAACIATHGAGRGSLLSIRRLCKCHPFHPGGYDPPPPRDASPGATGRPLPYSPPSSITGSPAHSRSRHPAANSAMPGADAPSMKAPSNGP